MSNNTKPFEVHLKRSHELATGGRWWSMGIAVTGVDIVAGPHLGDTAKLFHGEWERCVDASLIALLRNHAEPLADCIAAMREAVNELERCDCEGGVTCIRCILLGPLDRLDEVDGFVELPSLESTR